MYKVCNGLLPKIHTLLICLLSIPKHFYDLRNASHNIYFMPILSMNVLKQASAIVMVMYGIPYQPTYIKVAEHSFRVPMNRLSLL